MSVQNAVHPNIFCWPPVEEDKGGDVEAAEEEAEVEEGDVVGKGEVPKRTARTHKNGTVTSIILPKVYKGIQK